MKPEQQRIAIAEGCGWKRYGAGWKHPITGALHYRSSSKPEADGDCLPDYLNDLNAMHEAENTLDKFQRNNFAGWLYLGKNCSFQDYLTNGIAFEIAHKTAAQRAEAFLKTLNLWKD